MTERYRDWHGAQQDLTAPDFDGHGIVNRVRAKLDNPEARIRPEALAAAIDRHAPADAIFTSDTGMSTVWLSRFVTFHGTRRLIGSYNLGSMANAMPQALGAQALDRARKVVAFCGDGGLTMLLGDLITAVSLRAAGLPRRLRQRPPRDGQARAGAGRAAGVRHRAREPGPRRRGPGASASTASASRTPRRSTAPSARPWLHEGPVLLDVVTNPDEISLPPKVKPAQAWGFAVAKVTETLESRGA